jgi:hypothetical protein
MVLAGPADLAAGLGVWVVGLGGLEPPTSSLSVLGNHGSRHDPADIGGRHGEPGWPDMCRCCCHFCCQHLLGGGITDRGLNHSACTLCDQAT